MKRFLLLGFLAALLGATLPVTGAGFIVVDEAGWRQPPQIIPPWPHPPHPPTPIPPPIWRPHVFAPLEINFIKVGTKVNDQVAVTTVDQEFFNPNNAFDAEGLTALTKITETRRQERNLTVRNTEVAIAHGHTENSRGIGVADLAYAIRTGRPQRRAGCTGSGACQAG